MRIFESQSKGAHAEMTDAQLVAAARDGDKKAFVEIVIRHQAMVCGIALGILGDFAASEDAGQEAFLIAWKKFDQLADPERLRGWLGQIARNAALTQLRRRRGFEPLDQAADVEDPSSEPFDAIATKEESALVLKALNALPENYRMPLILFYREGKSTQAVAETLGINEATVRQRLTRGRDMLRDQLAGTVEHVLVRTSPKASFAIAVAAAIGALAAPSAVAATAWSGSSLVPNFLSIMSTSKTLLVVGALTVAVFVPVGYHVANSPAQPTVAKAAPQPEAVPIVANTNLFADSELLAEWKKLHEAHGSGAQAMPAMFKDVSDIKDTFRRRAFRMALISEWAALDPKSGFSFFSEKGHESNQRTQFLREWVDRDPQGAVAAMLSANSEWNDVTRSFLSDVARLSPANLGPLASKLPKSDSYWDNSVRDAFAVYAGADLNGARSAAEQVQGDNQQQALAGVAKQWATSDFDAVVKWVHGLPPGPGTDEVLRTAIVGKAATDPAGALDAIGMVPAGGRDNYFATTTGARVLSAAINADFDATIAWIAAHPGRLTPQDMMGMADAVTKRLNENPNDFLSQRMNDGSISAITPALSSALLNNSASQRAEVWNWLLGQPDDDSLKGLRQAVINSAGWQDPDFAMQIVGDIPPGKKGDDEVAQLAQSLLNGGQMLYRLDTLLQNGPDRLKTPLLEKAFDVLRSDNMDNPNTWINRVQQLPEDARSSAFGSIARAWAEKNPQDALQWAMSLPQNAGLGSAVGSATSAYAASDPRAAANWVSALPDGAIRDQAAKSLSMAIADNHPSEAWSWAISIQSEPERMAAAELAAKMLARDNLANAEQIVDSSPLSADLKSKLRASMNPVTGALVH